MLKGLNIHEKMLFSTKNIKYAVLFSVLMLLKGQGARPKGQGARPKGQGAFTIFKMRAGCSPLLHPSSSTTVIRYLYVRRSSRYVHNFVGRISPYRNRTVTVL